MAEFRRRRFIIVSPFQKHFIISRVIMSLVLALGLWFLIFYPVQLQAIADILDAPSVSVVGIPMPSVRVLLGILIILAWVGAMAVFESHRIAGPIYRVEQALRSLLAGEDPGLVHLRRGDNFTQLVPVLNELAVRYAASNRADRLLRETLRPALDELKALCGEAGTPAPVRSRVEELQARLGEILDAEGEPS